MNISLNRSQQVEQKAKAVCRNLRIDRVKNRSEALEGSAAWQKFGLSPIHAIPLLRLPPPPKVSPRPISLVIFSKLASPSSTIGPTYFALVSGTPEGKCSYTKRLFQV